MANFGQIPSNVPFNNFQVVTSATRPASPVEGDHIYETDTNRVYIWDGAAWQYTGVTAQNNVWGENTLRATASDEGPNDLDTNLKTMVSANITIPAFWNTYQVDMWASFRTDSNGSAGAPAGAASLTVTRLTWNAITIESMGAITLDTTSVGSRKSIAIVAGTTSTATGTIAAELKCQMNAEDQRYAANDIQLICRVWRVS